MSADDPPGPLRAIEIVALGDLDAEILDALVRGLSRRVGVPCRHAADIPRDALPRLAGRSQLDADAVLSLLAVYPATEGAILLGVTAEDLGHPLFTFFFGRARMGGDAVVSLHRLDPAYYGLPASRNVMLRRTILECVHELGHIAGLRHCRDYRCIMRFSGDVDVIDLRGRGFCEACATHLPRAMRHALHA